jgi:hypothetical protein
MRSTGVYTSEFWLSLVAIVCITLLLFFDKVSPQEIGGILGVAIPVAGYAISRGLAKTEAR